jgi:hypothetical protein
MPPMRTHRPRGLAAAALAGAILAGAAGRVAAEPDPPFAIGGRPVWFVMGGAEGGASLSDGRGGFAGGELSLVRLDEGRFAGVYGAALRDFGADSTLLSVGPELGLHVRRGRALPLSLAVDGGPAVELGDGTRWGGIARLSLTVFGTVSLYARGGLLDGEPLAQVGLALKFPLFSPLGGGSQP